MNIYERVSAVMAEVKGVEKSSTNSHGRYKYAGHEAVTEAIRGSMLRHGIVQTISTHTMTLHPGGHVSIAVAIAWTSKEQQADGELDRISSTIWALQHAQTSNGNPTAQQIGQAISYACKNFAFKTLMLTGDPDADSDAGPIEPPKVDTKLQNESEALLMGYAECESIEAIRAHNDKVQKWGRVGEVPGLRDKLVKSSEQAKRRLRGQQ